MAYKKGVPVLQPANPKQVMRYIATQGCAVDYDCLNAFYGESLYRRATIEKDIEALIMKGHIVGNIPRRYKMEALVALTPKEWLGTLKDISIADLKVLQTIGNDNSYYRSFTMVTAARQFALALCCYLHGEDYQEELASINWDNLFLPSYKTEVANQDIFFSYVNEVCSSPQCTEFAQQLPGEQLLNVFVRLYKQRWDYHDEIPDEEMVMKVFFSNPNLKGDVKDVLDGYYQYAIRLPRTGLLDDCIAHTPTNTNYYAMLGALHALHEGDYAKALKLYESVLKTSKATLFNSPLANFGYALALGLTKGEAAQTKATKLMTNKKISSVSEVQLVRFVLNYFYTEDYDRYLKFYEIGKLPYTADRILAAVFLKSIDVDEKYLQSLPSILSIVTSRGYRYYQLLFSFVADELKPEQEKLCEETGLTASLCPIIHRPPLWERVIDEVIEATAVKKSSGKAKEKKVTVPTERVAYEVYISSLNVQPKLQKSKDGGVTWTAGRNISLKTFRDGYVPGMTAQDNKVSRLVETYSYGWYGGVTYELEGPRVIELLIGHPAVFNAVTHELVDVVEEPLQLIASKQHRGFTVKTNVDLKEVSSDLYVTAVGSRQISVIRVSSEQRKLIELLAQVEHFPKESEEKLTRALTQLGAKFTVMSPLLKNAEGQESREADSHIIVQLSPSGRNFYTALSVKPFGDQPPYQVPAKGLDVISTKIDGKTLSVVRNIKTEAANLKSVRSIIDDIVGPTDYSDDTWLLDTAQCLSLLEQLRTATEVAYVEWPKGGKMRVVRPPLGASSIHLKVNSAGQWFEIEGEVTIDDETRLKVSELMERLRTDDQGSFIRLDGDEFIAISEQLRRQLQLLDRLSDSKKQTRVAEMNGLQLLSLRDIGVDIEADDHFDSMCRRIEEAEKLHIALPQNLRATLRPYQEEGFRWMMRLAWWGAGACLADDMGLGKTLQAIAVMLARAAQGPQLVVVPTSVLVNWQQEVMRFAPSLSIALLGNATSDRKQVVSDLAAGDLLITTYGLLVTEGELLASRQWTTIVLDEAHTIKNRDTQTSHQAMTLKGDFRLILTGTPLQNHLAEIWNLFQFATPGLLGPFQQFSDRFILPIERDHDMDRQRMLRRLLTPFLLRRTKEDVLSELPEKTEVTVRVTLSDEEKALYDNLRQQAIANLESDDAGAIKVLAEITRLRQAACNPRLVNSKLTMESSKMTAFLDLISEMMAGGHRALVFSQFTSHLALVRRELDSRGIAYLYLDGATPPAQRAHLVRDFQNGTMPIFLISLKAGGLGLNLTAADYVIHLDPWWNPAIEDQASDRAYRIGQSRPVTIYRLIASGTIEEKILRLHSTKRSMADALLEDSNLFTQLSAAEIVALLRENI